MSGAKSTPLCAGCYEPMPGRDRRTKTCSTACKRMVAKERKSARDEARSHAVAAGVCTDGFHIFTSLTGACQCGVIPPQGQRRAL